MGEGVEGGIAFFLEGCGEELTGFSLTRALFMLWCLLDTNDLLSACLQFCRQEKKLQLTATSLK